MLTTDFHCLTFDQQIEHWTCMMTPWFVDFSILLLKECYSILMTVSSIFYEKLDQFLWLFLWWVWCVELAFPSDYLFLNWPLKHQHELCKVKWISFEWFNIKLSDCSCTKFDSISATLSFSCTDLCSLHLLVVLCSFWFSSVVSFLLCEPSISGSVSQNW